MTILRAHSMLKFMRTLIIWYMFGINSLLASPQTTPVAQILPTSPQVQTTPATQIPPTSPALNVITKSSVPNIEWPLRVTSVQPEQAAMGEKITIRLDGLSQAIEDKNFDPKKLILYFGGYSLEGIYPESIDIIKDELIFKLKRNEENNKQWTSLIGSPAKALLPVRVSVGFKDQKAYPSSKIKSISTADDDYNFQFIVLRKIWFVGGIVIFILVIGLFVWLAKTSSIIRDSNPPLPHSGNTKPYRLAKLQASFWFFLVVGS